ncbi:hypothetical protein L9F63_002609, partial [Diploptera punctata]
SGVVVHDVLVVDAYSPLLSRVLSQVDFKRCCKARKKFRRLLHVSFPFVLSDVPQVLALHASGNYQIVLCVARIKANVDPSSLDSKSLSVLAHHKDSKSARGHMKGLVRETIAGRTDLDGVQTPAKGQLPTTGIQKDELSGNISSSDRPPTRPHTGDSHSYQVAPILITPQIVRGESLILSGVVDSLLRYDSSQRRGDESISRISVRMHSRLSMLSFDKSLFLVIFGVYRSLFLLKCFLFMVSAVRKKNIPGNVLFRFVTLVVCFPRLNPHGNFKVSL